MNMASHDLSSEPTTSASLENSPTVPKNMRSPLLNLPPELRNMIWQYSVVNENRMCTIRPTSQDFSCANWAPPPISRVCRETRSETSPMFLGQNTFVFSVSGFWPFFPILRRALTYFRATNPGRRLDGFVLEITSHYPVNMEDLVEYARIFGIFAAQLPEGLVPLRGIFERPSDLLDGSFEQVGVVKSRRNFSIFLQDLANIGRRLQETGLPYDLARYEVAIRHMMIEDGIERDHFRRFIVWDTVQALHLGRRGIEVQPWVREVGNRGEIPGLEI